MKKDIYFSPTLLFSGLTPGGDEEEEMNDSQAGSGQGPSNSSNNSNSRNDFIDAEIVE